MKGRVNQLQKGTIEYPKPVLEFGEEKLQGMIMPGKTVSLEISVASLNAVPMNLYFYSDNPRITVHQHLTVGRSGRFTVEVSTKGLFIGDRLSGEIRVAYNGGTRELPYEFSVVMAKNSNKEYLFRTPEEFIAFAESEPEEAAAVFSWKEFTEFPFMQDIRIRALYRVFSQQEPAHGLRQFLKGLGAADQETEAQPEGGSVYRSFPNRTSAAVSRNGRLKYSLTEAFLKTKNYMETAEDTAGCPDFGFDRIISENPGNVLSRLLKAWYCLKTGKISDARDLLIRVQDPIQKEKNEHKNLYCLFLYLVSEAQNDDVHRATALRLISKYYEEELPDELIWYLEYHLNEDYLENHNQSAEFLRKRAEAGFSDALLYTDLCSLWKKSTEGFEVLDRTVLTALLFGIRHGLTDEDTLFSLLASDLRDMDLLPLYMQVLKTGFRIFGNTDLLKGLVNLLIQLGRTDTAAFVWYDRAVRAGIAMEGLYESYLSSLSSVPEPALPSEFLVSAGEKKLDSKGNPEYLYAHILKYFQNDETITALYEQRIISFTETRLMNGEYSEALLPLYACFLDEKYLNERTAGGIMSLFYLKRVKTSLEGIQKVLIHYPQVQRDSVWPVTDGRALLPVYSDEAVIAMEDRYGHRFYDTGLSSESIFEETELKKSCALYHADMLMTKLSRADKIIRTGEFSDQDVFLLTDLIMNKSINDFYRSRLYETIIDLIHNPSMEHIDFNGILLEIDPQCLSRSYQKRLLTVLIEKNCFKEAYAKIKEYGFEDVPDDMLYSLANHILEEQVPKNDPWLQAIILQLHRKQKANNQQYSYLARYYNDTAREMLELASVLRKKRLATYDFAERTFTVCFFSDETRNLDSLFDWYMKEPRKDRAVVDAYMVLRSHEYFIKKRRLSEEALKELKRNVNSLPRICLLALITHYSTLSHIHEEDRAQAEALLVRAANENIVLKCFSKFEGNIRMPAELEGRVYIEYRSREAAEISVIGKIWPVQKYFHRELNQVYPGVFTRSFLLYMGEWIEYEISIKEKDGTYKSASQDVVTQENEPRNAGSRYDNIIRLSNLAEKDNLHDASEMMRTIIQKDIMINNIFGNNR